MTGGPYDPAAASHRALRSIQRELERHPAVTGVQGFPAGEYTQVVATLSPARLSRKTGDPTVTIRWFAGETEPDRPQFSIHYSDDQHDFGWHHEPNPHGDEWGHFQERTASETDYSYEPYEFGSANPSRVVWEVLSLLTDRL